eukprot:5097330-Amphidinium_carterae.2
MHPVSLWDHCDMWHMWWLNRWLRLGLWQGWWWWLRLGLCKDGGDGLGFLGCGATGTDGTLKAVLPLTGGATGTTDGAAFGTSVSFGTSAVILLST